MPHSPSHAHAFDKVLVVLREHGTRLTAPRRNIIEILTHEHGPFTVEEIHQRMKSDADLVTVYRTLATLEELDLVRRCDFGDGSYRYEFNDAEHHHHHIICRTCRSIRTLDFCAAAELERMARKLGYAHVTHTLEIFGICKDCQRGQPG